MDVFPLTAPLAQLYAWRESLLCAVEAWEPTARFQRTPWTHATGGGGEIARLKGTIFAKIAINWSSVHGPVFPTQEALGPFSATGVSLIAHMSNPHAPTVHANLRYITTPQRQWLGGGYDLTPMGCVYQEDTDHFHTMARHALDPFGKELYPTFKEQAERYFYIPHRHCQRGVGGIFFDHYWTGHEEADWAMWHAVGASLWPAIAPIYARRIDQSYTADDVERQQRARARYVEFNLLHDRGTRFGFLSGGNPEAILCSMPPTAMWD